MDDASHRLHCAGDWKPSPEGCKEIKDQREKKSLRFIISQYLHCISHALANPPWNLNKGAEPCLLPAASVRRVKLNTELLCPGAAEQAPRGQGKQSTEMPSAAWMPVPGDRSQVSPWWLESVVSMLRGEESGKHTHTHTPELRPGMSY